MKYLEFGDIARGMCGMQAQYCARYVDGSGDYPNLGQGLRIINNDDWYAIKVHRDDAAEFARRVNAHNHRVL